MPSARTTAPICFASPSVAYPSAPTTSFSSATKAIRSHLDNGDRFVIVTAPDARPYVRMIIERLFPTLPVLSHVEIAKGVEIRVLGTIS